MERVTGTGALWGQVREALERDALVVTANERAARGLRRSWDETLRAGGGERWEPARVMSWSAWTGSLWRRMLLEGRTRALLLNGFQEHAVWRGVLAGDQETTGGGLHGMDRLAEMAAESWARMCAYGEAGPVRGGGRGGRARWRPDLTRLGEEYGSRDTAAFGRWARAFAERCEAEQLLTLAELELVLARAVAAGDVAVSASEILLVGFDRVTAAAERLLARLGDAGVRVSHAACGTTGALRVLTSATDAAEELRACARWAAARMGREPGARIAVIVPDVAGERARMERVFREVLAPELELITSGAEVATYEFSLGRPIGEAPMMLVAMELLRWAAGALPLERVSALVVSDYFARGAGASAGRADTEVALGGSMPEREARAEFDAFELRRAGMLRPEISVREMVRRVAGSRRSIRLPGLLGALRCMELVADGFDGVSQSYEQWAQAMRELLAGAGWGAPGAETSEEFQVRERWEGALDAMATLDFEDQPVDYEEALRAIGWIAGKMIFAPESRATVVQVMGPLEAAGSEFDAVWFLRAGELSWPPVAGSLPLLPWGLQRDLRMPGTDMERDLEAARRLTERVIASGREVVVSYARHSGAMRQRASGILQGLELQEVAIGELAGSEAERLIVGVEREEDGGRVRALPDTPVSGGVRVLELQAACGFRAFAEQRLWSSELEERSLGFSAKESGTAVHAALEHFWTEVRSQTALISMCAEERDAVLLRSVDEGLVKARIGSAGAWDEAYLETQRTRLRHLLAGWLEAEMRRPAFEVSENERKLHDVRVGPLRFQLRVDRVDVVDEMRVVIDYKTGGAETRDWLGERPDAPQVPLYAILAARGGETGEGDAAADGEAGRRELGAVAFGRVKAGKDAGLKGFAAREGLLPGRLTRMEAITFNAQVERWEEVLERLAREFAAGEAQVRPKNYPTTCERCGQRVLCRLDASLLEEIEEDEAREGEHG